LVHIRSREAAAYAELLLLYVENKSQHSGDVAPLYIL
jgi:hypothetical protein